MNKLVMSQAPSMDYVRGWNNAVSDMRSCIKNNLSKAEQCLVDNGIEPDEAPVVLQALGYILLDEELYPE
jgi:hypothetical protein